MRRSNFKITAHAKLSGPVQENNIYRRYLHGDTAKSPRVTFFDISSALSPQAWYVEFHYHRTLNSRNNEIGVLAHGKLGLHS